MPAQVRIVDRFPSFAARFRWWRCGVLRNHRFWDGWAYTKGQPWAMKLTCLHCGYETPWWTAPPPPEMKE